MRIALISDIHGNLVALQTVLADIATLSVDRYVCLGDVAANGPQPREVIQRVRDLGCPVVRGNTDEWFLVPQTYDPNSEKERRLMALLEWAMHQFSADEIAFMRTFQPRIEVALENGAALLGFHGSPQSNTQRLRASTHDDELAQILSGYRATIMAGGHTHVPMLRRYRDMTIINPGSVGAPTELDGSREPGRLTALCEYAIVDSHADNLSVEFHRVPLDVNAVLQSARASGMPHVEEWIADWTKNSEPISQSHP
jgi:putative phosphoesterase